MTTTHSRGVLWHSLLGFGAAVSFLATAACSSSDKALQPQAQVVTGPEPVIPTGPDVCPALESTNGQNVHLFGVDLQMWVGQKQTDKKGPVLFYWHGTGSHAQEITAFMQPMLDEIQAEGGIAVSFESSTATGGTTGNNVWYFGDYDIADAILACAVQQLNIDKRRIYAAGCSAGGLQSGIMAMTRSSYLAGAIPNSGGMLVPEWQDLSHIPSVMTAHGTYDNDYVILHFADWSLKLDQEIANKGGYAVDCTHPNGHCMIFQPNTVNPPDLIAEVVGAQWQFLKDHPFGVSKDPYANGLPSSFPSFCVAVPPTADR